MNSMNRYTIMLVKDKGQAMRFNIRKEVLIFLCALLCISPFIIIFLFWQISAFSINNSALIDIAQDLQIRIDVLEAEKERYKTLDDYLADSSIHTLTLTSQQIIENDDNSTKANPQIKDNTNTGIPANKSPVTNEEFVVDHFIKYPDTPFNLGLIKVERVNFNKTRDKNRRNLIFDIRNAEKNNPLDGECRFILIKGGRNPKNIPLNTMRTTNFKINNYNQMSINLIAHEGEFELGDIVEFTIVSNGNIIYRQNLPIVD